MERKKCSDYFYAFALRFHDLTKNGFGDYEDFCNKLFKVLEVQATEATNESKKQESLAEIYL